MRKPMFLTAALAAGALALGGAAADEAKQSGDDAKVTGMVTEVDKDNNERTLKPGESVELKPGLGFSKKVRFRRG